MGVPCLCGSGEAGNFLHPRASSWRSSSGDFLVSCSTLFTIRQAGWGPGKYQRDTTPPGAPGLKGRATRRHYSPRQGRSKEPLLRQEIVFDSDFANLLAVRLEAADRDLDAAQRNRVGRRRDLFSLIIDDTVAIIIQAVRGMAAHQRRAPGSLSSRNDTCLHSHS